MTDQSAYSFDVYDTCLSRTYAQPRDLFYDMGLRLAPSDMAPAAKCRFAKTIWRRRIQAEKTAHRRSSVESVDIEEIYRHFRLPSTCASSKSDVLELELSLERRCTYAIPGVGEEIAQLRQAGHKIIFISDMYLPGLFLRSLLTDLGVMQHSDALYVSCDFGVTKNSGKLFSRVLLDQNIEANSLTHVGDNDWSDVKAAQKLGINARHYKDAVLNIHEHRMKRHDRISLVPHSRLVAHSKRSRLTFQAPYHFSPVLHSVVAPFLVSYVDWVFREARARGIRRLYFVARDGQVLFRIAKELVHGYDDIDIRYLHGSRRAWLTPSLIFSDPTCMRLIVTPGQSNTLSDILARVGLAADDQSAIQVALAADGTDPSKSLDEQSARSLLTTILRSPSLFAIIDKVVSNSRRQALLYFQQEGLLEDISWALVDVGWSLNCQAALKRILSQVKGGDFSPKGFYLALTSDHLHADKTGPAFSFIGRPGSLLSRRRVIVEHCFTPATDPSTRSYEESANGVRPVFGADHRTARELEYAAHLQLIAVHYAALLAADTQLRDELYENRNHIIRIAEAFISNPSIAEATALANFGTVADLRHESRFVNPLCKCLDFGDVKRIIRATISKKARFAEPAFMWLEGSCAISPFYVRMPIRIMLAGDRLASSFKGAIRR